MTIERYSAPYTGHNMGSDDRMSATDAATFGRPVESVHPREVDLQAALETLADPVRMQIVRALAGAEDFTVPCGAFDVAVSKATLSHHFAVLRSNGVIEQRDVGVRRLNRLRKPEFDERFPGLLDLVIAGSGPSDDTTSPDGPAIRGKGRAATRRAAATPAARS
jgi:DNA-binding transcriptional ArsR family regulator